MLIYYLLVWPYRTLLNRSYCLRPKASVVLSNYIRSRHCPSWTSFFLPYKFVQDDLFGEKHFNFEVDGCNYHVLRIGCYPFVKYHCTQRPKQDLHFENSLYKFLTIFNFGLPCLLYGLAATFLIKHTDHLKTTVKMGPDSGYEFAPTIHSVILIFFILAPLMYLSARLVVYLLGRLVAFLKYVFRKLYFEIEEPVIEESSNLSSR
ncbi:hypothetical protein M3Y97_00423900 [Aphelenchoides bicaudatus]|nr:hypothetical protein M3Y97_00423900 [Aphelenchoides bicaudatus]